MRFHSEANKLQTMRVLGRYFINSISAFIALVAVLLIATKEPDAMGWFMIFLGTSALLMSLRTDYKSYRGRHE